ncbi:hypothetical protein V1512DRAFT_220785 [Lipomyces arxii]|uniref:uncharacterized protein n=1 Tax=Lipomyces arxii TaxID=56418 RepID=UPI0034CE39CB
MADLSSDEDMPLAMRVNSTVDSTRASRKRKSVTEVDYKESESDEEVPLNKRVTSKKMKKEECVKSKKVEPAKSKPKKKETPVVESKPKRDNAKPTPVPKPKVKAEANGSATKASKQKSMSSEQDEEDEAFRWWEAEQNDGTIKWTTLSHQGVLFPPPYEPLPKHVKLKYKSAKVDLPLEAEEVAGFFGAMLETDHAKNKVFQANFFEDFKAVLERCSGPKPKIEKFELCDFTDIYNYYDEQRQKKKAMTAAEKKKIKEAKDKAEEKYKVCYLDGRKELVGNFRIEPPGLFRGRGSHPKTGKLKARVQPEQVTLNIGPEAELPAAPDGHEWADVKHDNTVTWLATWKENINGATKYVMLSANSSLKGMSDMKKFEKARMLKHKIHRIRKDYTRELKDEVMANRQRATAMYLIDVLALRAGGEKGDDEADTVGCCSLRYEHITLKPPNTVVFDFLGKDSIRFYQEVEVDTQVFKNLKLFKKPPKTVGDQLFDRLDPPTLNRHLQNYMPGLSAKVFRTYNASKTMQDQLDKIANVGTVNEKFVAYNAANRAVAILCNHQRSVPKTHEISVGKIEDKILEMKFQRYRLKQMISDLEPKKVKAEPEFFEKDEDLTDEAVSRLVDTIVQRERDKVTKKFAKDNEKREVENEDPLPESKLEEDLESINELEKEYKLELKTGKPVVKSGSTVEKLQVQIEKIGERIINTSLQLKDKEDNSTVALTTSKINYIDPRLSVMFSKKFNVPLEKLFSKTLRDKFKWAIESANENWRF